MWKNKKVGVLMGGPSSEREVSLRTGQAVLKALREKGYEAVELDLHENTAAQMLAQGVQVVYNALHGKWGEDGCVQGLLEVLRIPYTGPGVTASAVGMDKVISKRLFEAEGLAVPPYRVIRRADRRGVAADSPFGWPVVAKPATEGSSVGTAIATTPAELAVAMDAAFQLDERILLEQYLPGREIQVAVLGDDPLGLVEVRPKKMPGEKITFYDYAHKYTKGMTEYFTRPENLDDATAAEIMRLAVVANRAIGGEGLVRVDLILDGAGRPWVLEVNTLPGLTELSLAPMIARDWRGLAFADLVEKVLDTARLKIGV
jgi:D-alanine-D-alanine ligase